MGIITVTRRMQADPDAVWAVLDDFGSIANWSSGVTRSENTNAIARGIGAERHCDFDAKGRQWAKERITARSDDNIHISIYETNAPMSRFEADITVRPSGSGSHLTFLMDIVVKGGPLGKVMEVLMVRRQLRKQIGQLLADLDAASAKLVAA